MNRSQVELMSLQYGGLNVRTRQGLGPAGHPEIKYIGIESSSMNRSQVELMSLQYGGLDVRTRQGLASRDEAGCSSRCQAAIPTGEIGWLVLKSTARAPGLGYHADGPGDRTGMS